MRVLITRASWDECVHSWNVSLENKGVYSFHVCLENECVFSGQSTRVRCTGRTPNGGGEYPLESTRQNIRDV